MERDKHLDSCDAYKAAVSYSRGRYYHNESEKQTYINCFVDGFMKAVEMMKG